MKRLDSLKIWIMVEIAAVVVLIGVIVVKTVFAKGVTEEATYTIPTEEASATNFEDVVLPKDFYAEDEADEAPSEEETSLFSMDAYPEEAIAVLSGMTSAQKISSILVTSPEALCDLGNLTVAGDIFHEEYSGNPVGGLIFSDSNFTSTADGMAMLKSLREWSRETVGMNMLLGYREQDGKKMEELSERGFNLYCMEPETEGMDDLVNEAKGHSMVPAIITSLDEYEPQAADDVVVIGQAGGAQDIVDSINAGQMMLYSTDDHGMKDKLVEALEGGEITEEALDHAAAYAVTVRLALTASRPEDMEKEADTDSAEETGATASEVKKSSSSSQKKSAEELAAEALQKQIEDASRETQRQAEELQKQVEEAAKAAASQQTNNGGEGQ